MLFAFCSSPWRGIGGWLALTILKYFLCLHFSDGEEATEK
jgi:hypothetical protein